MTCVGKGMGNGYPVSAVVGKREIMPIFDEIFFSFTFGGEAVSLAAALATLRELKEKNVISHLWTQGQKLRDGFNVLARGFGIDRYFKAAGLPPRPIFSFKDETGRDSLLFKSLFQQECLKRGILLTGAQNVCFSHSHADIDYTLRVYRTVFEIMADAIGKKEVASRLEGKPVEPVFRKV